MRNTYNKPSNHSNVNSHNNPSNPNRHDNRTNPSTNPNPHNLITADDIPQPYSALLEVLTVDEIIKLSNAISGIRVYFKRGSLEETKAFDIISECISYSKAVKLCRIYAGEHIYFTSLDHIRTQKLHETIKAEFNGYNTMTLALRYGYSEYYINSIVNGRGGKKASQPMEGQIGIDEML